VPIGKLFGTNGKTVGPACRSRGWSNLGPAGKGADFESARMSGGEMRDTDTNATPTASMWSAAQRPLGRSSAGLETTVDPKYLAAQNAETPLYLFLELQFLVELQFSDFGRSKRNLQLFEPSSD
jgi:hypothetical protein